MLDPIWQRFDGGARSALPFLTAVLCTLLSVAAWPIPWLGPVAPPLALMAVYYWTVHRPDLLRPGLVFIIGLLNDVVNFLPLGLSALLFIAAHQAILRLRRFFAGHTFFMIWSGFILTAVCVMLAEWLLLCVIRWQGVPLLPVLMQTLLAIVFFPLPCWLFIRLQRATLSTG
jgi:rod shape-determining protein MreD